MKKSPIVLENEPIIDLAKIILVLCGVGAGMELHGEELPEPEHCSQMLLLGAHSAGSETLLRV